MLRRLTVLAEYRTEPGMEAILGFFHDMGMDGTSSDEECQDLTDEFAEPTYRVHSIPSIAPEVADAKDKIDQIYVRFLKPRYPVGSAPRRRERRGSQSTRRKRHYGLAQNGYDNNWLDSLLDIERRDLRALPAISFDPLDRLLE